MKNLKCEESEREKELANARIIKEEEKSLEDTRMFFQLHERFQNDR